MAEGGCWNIFSRHPVDGREVLTMTRCPLERGSSWRNAGPTSRSCCSMGYIGLLPLPELGQTS